MGRPPPPPRTSRLLYSAVWIVHCSWGWIAVLAGGWLQMLVQTLSLGNLSALPDLLLRTRTGNLILYRQFFTGLLLLSLIASVIRTPAGLARRWVRIVVIVYTLMLAVAVFSAVIPSPGPLVYLIIAFDLAAISFAILPLRQWQGKQRLLVGVQWVLGAAVLITFSIGSHAAAVAGRGWAILGDYVHLIAAAAWLGGIGFANRVTVATVQANHAQ